MTEEQKRLWAIAIGNFFIKFGDCADAYSLRGTSLSAITDPVGKASFGLQTARCLQVIPVAVGADTLLTHVPTSD